MLLALTMLLHFSTGRVATAEPRATTVGIIKFATHPALDELEQGLLKTLQPFASRHGNRIESYNANGRPERAHQLAQLLTRPDVALIISIATPATQAVARIPSHIPLLYGAVADPAGAGVLSPGRVTGIRNVSPTIIDAALHFIRILLPAARHLGYIYNPAEQNSVYVHGLLTTLAPRYHFTIVERTINDPTKTGSVTDEMSHEVDVIYSANDNTVNAGIDSLVAVATDRRIPFIIGDLSSLTKGPLAAIGLNYSELGTDLANLAVRLLSGTPVSAIPPQDPPPASVWLNENTRALINLDVPPQARKLIMRVL